MSTARATPLVYRISVATEKLGVSRSTIYRLVDAKKLTKVKISERASGITADSLTALLQSGQHLKAV